MLAIYTRKALFIQIPTADKPGDVYSRRNLILNSSATIPAKHPAEIEQSAKIRHPRKYCAQSTSEWVQATASVETANVEKVFIIEGGVKMVE